MATFNDFNSNASNLYRHFKKAVYYWPLSPLDFLVLFDWFNHETTSRFFEPANPGLEIGKHLSIHYFFILTKRFTKDLKYKRNMINKTSLHPISPPPSNKNIPHSKLKQCSCKISQLPLLSSGIFCPLTPQS